MKILKQEKLIKIFFFFAEQIRRQSMSKSISYEATRRSLYRSYAIWNISHQWVDSTWSRSIATKWMHSQLICQHFDQETGLLLTDEPSPSRITVIQKLWNDFRTNERLQTNEKKPKWFCNKRRKDKTTKNCLFLFLSSYATLWFCDKSITTSATATATAATMMSGNDHNKVNLLTSRLNKLVVKTTLFFHCEFHLSKSLQTRHKDTHASSRQKSQITENKFLFRWQLSNSLSSRQ